MAEGAELTFFDLDGGSKPSELAAWLKLANDATARLSGNHDNDRPADNPVAYFTPNEFREFRVFGAGLPLEPEGLVHIALPLKDNLSLAMFGIFRSAETELTDELLTEALRRIAVAGRKIARTFVDARDAQLLEILSGNGFVETQRFSTSVLYLEADYAELWAEATAAAVEYELVFWRERCPDELVDGFALASSRMSTDAPQGEAVVEEQVWDAARVRRVEAASVEQGFEIQVAAVRAASTGEFAGYTALHWHKDRPGLAAQGDTLVLREHRGHRLGQLLKVANLREARKRWPELSRIHTDNAEENAPMLRINRAMGFTKDKTVLCLDLTL